MNDLLWEKAKELADRPYHITQETDELSDGQKIILLRHPELKGCKAQGFNLDEATKNLYEARVDYLYALLISELPIPDPKIEITLETSDTIS